MIAGRIYDRLSTINLLFSFFSSDCSRRFAGGKLWNDSSATKIGAMRRNWEIGFIDTFVMAFQNQISFQITKGCHRHCIQSRLWKSVVGFWRRRGLCGDMVKITRMLHHLIANNRSQSPRRSKCSELLLSCHDERAAATRSAGRCLRIYASGDGYWPLSRRRAGLIWEYFFFLSRGKT